MLDKIMATISLAAFIGFMLIVLVWINEIDLWIIVVIVLAMAIYDFVLANRKTDDRTEE